MKKLYLFSVLLLVFAATVLPSKGATAIKLYSNMAGVNTWNETKTFTKVNDTKFYTVVDAADLSFDFYFRIDVDGYQWGPYNTYYSQDNYAFPSDASSYTASTSYYDKAFALEQSTWGGYSYYLIVAEQISSGWYSGRWNISVYGLQDSYEIEVSSSPVSSTADMTNYGTWYGYNSIESACSASNLYTQLCAISSQLDPVNGYGWPLIKQLKLSGQLNYADVIVLHWLANHNALYGNLLYDERTTGGSLEVLDLSDATFCVETLNSSSVSLCIFVSYNSSTDAVVRVTPGYASTSVSEIPSDVFAYTKLREVVLNDNTTRILQSAFRGCTSLEQVEFPSKLQEIVKFAFWPTKMTDVDLTVCPELTTIGERAFLAESTPGSYPKNVYFPANQISFGSNVFAMSDGGYTVRTDIDLYFPMSVMDYSRGVEALSGYCSDDNMRFAPMLEKGNWIRTFSFDRDLNYNDIQGRRTDKADTSTQTLQAYRASAYDKSAQTVTLQSSLMKLSNGEGVVIKGEGAVNEFYPIPPSDGDTNGSTNYMKGSADATLYVATHPTATSTAFILLTDGEFYYSTGGTLAKYKAYFQTPEKILVITDPGYTGTSSHISINWDDSTTGISSVPDIKTEAAGQTYTLDGRKVTGQTLKKGIYIRNGRKEVVK